MTYGEALAEWTVSKEPITTIGHEADEDGHDLHSVTDALVLSDGRIVVANAGSFDVRFYSSSGDYLGSVGGEGPGPSQFTRPPASLALAPGDTVVVWTQEPALVWVSPEMALVRKSLLHWSDLSFHCRTRLRPKVLSDASLIILAEDGFGGTGCASEPTGVYRTTTLLARYDASTGTRDTFGIFPGYDQDQGRFAAYGRMFSVAVAGERIFAADTGGDSIMSFSLSGELLSAWHVPLQRTPIRNGGGKWFREPVQMPDGRLFTDEPYSVPEAYPRLGRLVADDTDNVWIMQYPTNLEEPPAAWRLESIRSAIVDAAGGSWIVVDRTGRAIASVRTPSGMHVVRIGEAYVLGVVRDSLDVESVTIHRLVRS